VNPTPTFNHIGCPDPEERERIYAATAAMLRMALR
jgi:hypothetical protein